MTGDSPVNKFKNANGVLLLKQLFFETADTERSRVLYTLKNEDHEGYPSLRRLYLEQDDETEFFFAEAYFDGWHHWKKLLQCSWFLAQLEPIREELATRNAARNLREIRKAAESGNVSASRYLLEGGWKPKGSAGRPTKQKIKQEAEKLFLDSQDIKEDLDRLTEFKVKFG